jgi:hypothetical protein
MVYAWIWVGDGTDTAAKLSDPLPLTLTKIARIKSSRDKLVGWARCSRSLIGLKSSEGQGAVALDAVAVFKER